MTRDLALPPPAPRIGLALVAVVLGIGTPAVAAESLLFVALDYDTDELLDFRTRRTGPAAT